ncbi:hypothetical protein L218DRAFT_850475, partial [Marasmius fiardii PR-910]
MEDINPSFVPRTRILRELPLSKSSVNRSQKGKGKIRDSAASEGILSFFGPNPKIPQMPKSPSIKAQGVTHGKIKMVVGRESGKRTLPDIHDQDLNAKKRKTSAKTDIRSRFFSGHAQRTVFGNDSVTPTASSYLMEKENECIVIDDCEIEEAAGESSIIAQHYS